MTNKHNNDINLTQNYKEGIMRKLQTILITFAALLALTGCEDSGVKRIKEGITPGFPNTSNGKAFNASFDNAKWEAFETDKGVKAVQFTGTITEKTHRNAAADFQSAWSANQNNPSIAIPLFNKALKKAIGKESFKISEATKNPVISKFLTQYNCELIDLYTYNMLGATCGDNQSHKDFTNAMIQHLVDSSWKAGTPVRVEWHLHQKGNGFDLIRLESDAWVGVTAEDILEVIFS